MAVMAVIGPASICATSHCVFVCKASALVTVFYRAIHEVEIPSISSWTHGSTQRWPRYWVRCNWRICCILTVLHSLPTPNTSDRGQIWLNGERWPTRPFTFCIWWLPEVILWMLELPFFDFCSVPYNRILCSYNDSNDDSTYVQISDPANVGCSGRRSGRLLQ